MCIDAIEDEEKTQKREGIREEQDFIILSRLAADVKLGDHAGRKLARGTRMWDMKDGGDGWERRPNEMASQAGSRAFLRETQSWPAPSLWGCGSRENSLLPSYVHLTLYRMLLLISLDAETILLILGWHSAGTSSMKTVNR